MNISELRYKMVRGLKTPTDILEDTLAVVHEKNKKINAYLELFECSFKMAKKAEYIFKEKGEDAPPLCGIPIAVKNNILVEGEITTASSKILKNYRATYDATIIARLKEQGAIFVGATNMDEFAMGSSTENSSFGPTRNPHDLERVPGGSSGGSAASVAMGSVPVALGTDTGGSIRQPASYCGIVGFKPTYGAVSRYGLIAMGSSLDQAGPLTTTVIDAKSVHQVISGIDNMDATTIKEDTYSKVDIKPKYKIGIPRKFIKEGIDKDVVEMFESHIDKLKKSGHSVVDIELPLFEKGLAAYYIVMPAEVSSNLARYDGIRFGSKIDGADLLDEYMSTRAGGFGREVKRRILLGTYVLSSGYYDAYYGKAEEVRALMRIELAAVFQKVDLILTPTAPTPAFKFGEQEDPLSMYKQDVFTVPANLTGAPALSIPGDVVRRGDSMLPVGVQYIAPLGGDNRLFDIGISMYDKSLSS